MFVHLLSCCGWSSYRGSDAARGENVCGGATDVLFVFTDPEFTYKPNQAAPAEIIAPANAACAADGAGIPMNHIAVSMQSQK
jgi:hypothetical protein